jgi:uncharacterized protein YhdP
VAWRQAQDLRETWTASTPVTGGEVAGDRLNLDTLARIAESAPLGEPLRALARQPGAERHARQPEGALGRAAGPAGQLPARCPVQQPDASGGTCGQRHGSPGRPGLRQAGLKLSANERGGQARLSIENGALVFPGLWEQPEVPLDTLQAALSWRIQATPGQPSVLEFKLADARIANADLQAEVDATWHSGAGAGQGRGGRFPGTLDLNARLQRARAESVARYLPLGLSAAVREHVRDAVQGGSITAATFKVKGDLANFPFHSAREGQLRITLQVRDLVYAYLPSRPARRARPPMPRPGRWSSRPAARSNSTAWR